MLAQLVSVALTASVKATDSKSVSSFNHFLSVAVNLVWWLGYIITTYDRIPLYKHPSTFGILIPQPAPLSLLGTGDH